MSSPATSGFAPLGVVETHLAWVLKLDEIQVAEASALIKDWMQHQSMVQNLNPWFEACESPIERLFLLGVVQVSAHVSGLFSLSFASSNTKLRLESRETSERFELMQQVSPPDSMGFSRGTRFDFVLMDEKAAKATIIECDGHEFHERSQEQVSRDNARDRRLAMYGSIVARFSGSEIYNDPFRCAEEAFVIAHNKARSDRNDRDEITHGMNALIGRMERRAFRSGFSSGRSWQRRMRRLEGM